MAVDIWPVSALAVPLDHSLDVDAIINNFGARQTQRIVTDFPHTGADGIGGVTKHVGRHSFKVVIPRLLYLTQPVTGNANLDNSVRILWAFYQSTFYDVANDLVQYAAFYFYSPLENSDTSTWTGDISSSGTNCFGEAVTQVTGRYLVIFSQPSLSRIQFTKQICKFGVSLTEVDA